MECYYHSAQYLATYFINIFSQTYNKMVVIRYALFQIKNVYLTYNLAIIHYFRLLTEQYKYNLKLIRKVQKFVRKMTSGIVKMFQKELTHVGSKVRISDVQSLHHRFSQQQDREIVRVKKMYPKISWAGLSNIIFKKFNVRVRPIQIKRQWLAIIHRRQANKPEIYRFFHICRKERFNYYAVAEQMKQTPFEVPQYCMQFMQRLFVKMLKKLVVFGQKKLDARGESLQSSDIDKAATCIVKSQMLHRGLRTPVYLRDQLVRIYEEKISDNRISKVALLQAYNLFCRFRDKIMAKKIVYNQYGGWMFLWTQKELQRLFELYQQFGSNFYVAAKIMRSQMGQKQTYNWPLIRSRMIRQQRASLYCLLRVMRAKQIITEEQIPFKINPKMSAFFILQKTQKDFAQSVKLMGLAYGSRYSCEQYKQLYNYVLQVLTQQRNPVRRTPPPLDFDYVYVG